MRRLSRIPGLSGTTAVALAAILLIAGIALVNMARVDTDIPTGIYVPKVSTGPPLAASPAGDPSRTAPSGGSAIPSSAGTVAKPPGPGSPAVAAKPVVGSSVQRPPTPTTYPSSSNATPVNTVAPYYGVDVSGDDQPSSSSGSGGSGDQSSPSTSADGGH